MVCSSVFQVIDCFKHFFASKIIGKASATDISHWVQIYNYNKSIPKVKKGGIKNAWKAFKN
jgi:hypothetical protein